MRTQSRSIFVPYDFSSSGRFLHRYTSVTLGDTEDDDDDDDVDVDHRRTAYHAPTDEFVFPHSNNSMSISNSGSVRTAKTGACAYVSQQLIGRAAQIAPIPRLTTLWLLRKFSQIKWPNSNY